MTILWIILSLLKITVSLVALTVLLSYTVAWYERANARPELIERRFTSRGLFIACWLLVQETVCLLVALLLRPFGWFPARLPAKQHGGSPPVILLHGLFQNRSCLSWLQRRLHTAGYGQVLSINTPPSRDLENLTELLAKKVDELRIRLKVDKVILVGHSMGGIIARNYVQNRGGTAYVERVVTLGAPHRGSKLAPFALTSMGKNLLPGSEFIRHFNDVAWPQEIPIATIYTRYDNIVMPADLAWMPGARAVELDGMGHTALLFHPRALQAVVDALR